MSKKILHHYALGHAIQIAWTANNERMFWNWEDNARLKSLGVKKRACKHYLFLLSFFFCIALSNSTLVFINFLLLFVTSIIIAIIIVLSINVHFLYFLCCCCYLYIFLRVHPVFFFIDTHNSIFNFPLHNLYFINLKFISADFWFFCSVT